MKFYRRYYADARCVVVCTRCFATLGTAATLTVADELERQHLCGARVRPEFSDAALRCYAEHSMPKYAEAGGLRKFCTGRNDGRRRCCFWRLC